MSWLFSEPSPHWPARLIIADGQLKLNHEDIEAYQVFYYT